MKKLKIAGAAVVGVLVLLVAIGFVLPSTWTVRREATLSAPPEALYPLLASFKNGWPLWNPFGPKMDPSVHVTFSGPEEGVGAVQSFEGGQLDKGVMRIVEADPAKGVVYLLEANPVHIRGTLALERTGEGTHVVWTDEGDMGGHNPFMNWGALMAGKMSGEPMEKGLADLGAHAKPANR